MTAPRSPLSAQVDRLDRARVARRLREPLRDERVTLSHGSGGKASHRLIDGMILPTLGSAGLTVEEDSAVLSLTGLASGRVAFTTDSYVVSPLFFPGGDIGSLAVHGTINDLATAGAQPLCLSLAFILEEGLEIDVLRSVVESIGVGRRCGRRDDRHRRHEGRSAREGRPVVHQHQRNRAGRRRPVVVGRANPRRRSGAPQRPDRRPRHRRDARPRSTRDRSRHSQRLRAAPPHGGGDSRRGPDDAVPEDPTRGGVATSLNEMARQAGVAIAIDERRVPVRADVRAACEMLGLDPLHIANEGKLIAIVRRMTPHGRWRPCGPPHGHEAASLARCSMAQKTWCCLKTEAGGSRVLDMLVGDPLPRIC